MILSHISPKYFSILLYANMTPEELVHLRFDLMHSVYMTGDLDEIDRCFAAGIDPNLGDMSAGEALHIYTEGGDLSRDDLGVFFHIFEGGTLISLVENARHSHVVEVVESLLRHGCDANHPENMRAALRTPNPLPIVKLLVEYGATVDSDTVVRTFYACVHHSNAIEVLEYLYNLGIRVSRHDREKLMSITEKCANIDNDDLWNAMCWWTERFTRRRPFAF